LMILNFINLIYSSDYYQSAVESRSF